MLLNCGFEEDFESPSDSKEIKPLNSKGNQPCIFIRTDAQAEAPTFWPSEAKNWVTGKDPDAGNNWSQEEKGTTQDEKVGWHHWLNRHESEQAPEVGDGQGSLVCWSPCGGNKLDTTEWLNWLSDLWLQMWSFLENIQCLLEKKVKSTFFGYNYWYISIRCNDPMYHLKLVFPY